MRKILCKIHNFILGTFTDVIDAVAYGLSTVGEVIVKAAKGVIEAVGDAAGSLFGGSSSFILLGLLGVGLFLAMGSGSDQESSSNREVTS